MWYRSALGLCEHLSLCCVQISCPVGLLCVVIIFNSKEQKTLTQPAPTVKRASCHLVRSRGRMTLGWSTQQVSYLLVLLCSHLQFCRPLPEGQVQITPKWCLFLSSILKPPFLNLSRHSRWICACHGLLLA